VVEAAGYSFADLPEPQLDPDLVPGALRGLETGHQIDEIWPDSQAVAEDESTV
jgi:hypothetical protein